AYSRALELCRQVGETPQLFPALWGLARYYNLQSEFKTARELSEQLLSLAQQMGDPARLLEAHFALAAPMFWCGELKPARAHCEQGVALYDPQQHQSLSSRAALDLGVGCLDYLARALWLLGYPDQALVKIHEALALAEKLSHPFSIARGLNFTAWLHHFRREHEAARERAEAEIALSKEYGFAQWEAIGTILRGWALALQGQADAGVAQISQGIAAHREKGGETARAYYMSILAEAYERAGQTWKGLAALAEATEVVNNTGERIWEAEVHRLRGELLLKEGGSESEVQGCFRHALDVSRRQEAKSLELRAVMSLGRLWQKQGKKEEARQMLAEIYGWFTEGFDTADLKEAKALLEELS
ncbi:MAG: hypothetical protein ACE5MH_10375, partial [Terriglobia bacterium]